MAEIVLCRVDSRLIHGQVMTKWVNQSRAEKIVVIDNEFASDEFLKEVCLMSAPVGLDVVCYTEQEGITEYKKDSFGSKRVLLLTSGLANMKSVYEAGIKTETIQIGGLGGAPNRKVVFQNITLDDKDVEVLKYFIQVGVKVIFQTIPEDLPQSVENILKKYRQ
ncbi:PTS system, D-glucosaminate-specific IIB component [Propionispira arboris]|uniref:PTS system, D-glucosaminate-specific IIB component n=1 Tax=Propionispira arboris TaxID=84035 RepID=A0A1H7C4Z0_9FIRM|nr:PTS sugar transporter subunit IIB [Propionispira arboris]SEJ84761.1 PTS system, D-glucosaminate-specific IIB component [Propionispira arboris]